jgi:uncharacterized protein
MAFLCGRCLDRLGTMIVISKPLKNTLTKLEKSIYDVFSNESSGHDLHHLKRVMNLAIHIQEKEGGDLTVIAVSALLHDVHRVIQIKTGKYCSPHDSLPQIRILLGSIQLSDLQKQKILHCIEHHEEYSFSSTGKTVWDIEAQIVQDADNLDAIGAIGIGRTFSYGGAHGLDMWIPEKPFDRKIFDEDKPDPSTIHHFYAKLLKLKSNMNTKTAKKIAQSRHDFMLEYLKEFFAEWIGRK